MLVTEYCEGGNLARNIIARKVTWYKRGRKVRQPFVWLGCECIICWVGTGHIPLAAGVVKPALLSLLLQIAIDIAKGLVFLHSRRIVHLDLKSPNILLSRWVPPPCVSTSSSLFAAVLCSTGLPSISSGPCPFTTWCGMLQGWHGKDS